MDYIIRNHHKYGYCPTCGGLKDYKAQTCRGCNSQAGEHNHNYKHGQSADNMHWKRLQQQRYPERWAARTAVHKALRAGTIRRGPCEVCGDVDTQAHHDDYGKPLEVRWLCAECHRALHRAIRAREI